MFGESFKFFDSSTTKWRSFNFFAKLNGDQILMATFSKFHKYQTFGLIELHNVSKGQLADRIFKLCLPKLYLRLLGRRTYNFWNSDFLIFPTFKFKQILLRILWKNFQFTKQILKALIKFYPFNNIYDLRFLDNETTALWFFLFFIFYFFWFPRKSVLLLKFCQMRGLLKPHFYWYF